MCVEFRQLRFFVTLAEELHFGRAAAREHIVQSTLSQQIRRLERELNVRLFNRDTHHVGLTPAGVAFLADARQLLAHAERAAATARRAAAPAVLRAGMPDACCDSVPRVLAAVQEHYPDLEIHQVETGVQAQVLLLAEGKLDVAFGRAPAASPEIDTELIRLDPLGVLVLPGHPFTSRGSVPVALLDGQPLLVPASDQAPELSELVADMCQAAGVTPAWYRGTVDSVWAAAGLARQGRCVPCVPGSCAVALPGVTWQPLSQPGARYPWSVMWRAGDRARPVTAAVTAARRLAGELGWLGEPAARPARPGRRRAS
jgi:DNA-binding transcriptional LysR family regulator